MQGGTIIIYKEGRLLIWGGGAQAIFEKKKEENNFVQIKNKKSLGKKERIV